MTDLSGGAPFSQTLALTAGTYEVDMMAAWGDTWNGAALSLVGGARGSREHHVRHDDAASAVVYPSHDKEGADETGSLLQHEALRHSRDSLRELDGGVFLMGTDDEEGFPADGEGPVREVEVAAFAVDTKAVSNDDFAAFVEATGYQLSLIHI